MCLRELFEYPDFLFFVSWFCSYCSRVTETRIHLNFCVGFSPHFVSTGDMDGFICKREPSFCHVVSIRKRGDPAGDVGTSGLGDAATHSRSIEFQKWENIHKKVALLMLFCKNDNCMLFKCQLNTAAKFKSWILENSFSPPVTELDCETKQKT